MKGVKKKKHIKKNAAPLADNCDRTSLGEAVQVSGFSRLC